MNNGVKNGFGKKKFRKNGSSILLIMTYNLVRILLFIKLISLTPVTLLTTGCNTAIDILIDICNTAVLHHELKLNYLEMFYKSFPIIRG